MHRLWLVLLVLSAGAQGRELRPGWDEADKSLPPWVQYYNKLKGRFKFPFEMPDDPESLNVRCVGRWGRGPAARVTGRDSLTFVAMGSEVAVFNCVDAGNPRVINEIQCRYVVDRAILRDTLLYAVLQGGVEVFNVANPASVTRIKYLSISAVDMCIRDSLAYTIDAESLKVYRIVSPESLQRVGACADSGYYITADAGFAYVCDRWGLYVLDCTDPTNPHWASTLSLGIETRAAWVDSGYCYYTETYPNSAFVVADVSDPHHPGETGRIAGIAGYDVCKIDFYVYLPGFQIVDVSLPDNPALISSVPVGGFGVWTRSPFSFSFVAGDYGGLAVVNITDPVHPFRDTTCAGASASYDVYVDGGYAYVANFLSGMKILSLASPADPREVGCYDTIGYAPEAFAVRARDSFAYLITQHSIATGFRDIDVSSPENPALAGYCRIRDLGYAASLRDSLVYVAEDYHFEVFSIANPRQPRLVGSCGLPDDSYGMCLRESLAYVANQYAGLQIINVARPDSPVVIGSFSMPGWTNGVFVSETLAYVASKDIGTRVVNVKDPRAPFEVCTITTDGAFDVYVQGDRAFIGGRDLKVADVSDPANPTVVGYYDTPSGVRRITGDSHYVYCACFGAGVIIVETTNTSGIADADCAEVGRRTLSAFPNPTTGLVTVCADAPRTANGRVRFYDAAGRLAIEVPAPKNAGLRAFTQRVDMSRLPAGAYFVRVEEPANMTGFQKVIKLKGR